MSDSLLSQSPSFDHCSSDAAIIVENLAMSYDGGVIQKDLNFTVNRNDIFIIMGNSGSGKSTLMRTMSGLHEPDQGDVFYNCTSVSGESALNNLR